MKTVVTARRLYTPVEEITNPLLVSRRRSHHRDFLTRFSRSSCKCRARDFGDAALAPGFLDIHIHGGAGLDVMRASAAELPRLGQFLISHGVTGYFATTVAAPLDSTCAALERLADAIEAETVSEWTRCRVKRARSGFISKDHFLAISGGEFIRLSIWSNPQLKSSKSCGRPRAGMSA